MATLLLPSDPLPTDTIPQSSKTLHLGPGLRSLPSSISATTAGTLQTSTKKNALWLHPLGGRYLPSVGDNVVATIHHSSAEAYSCVLVPHTPFALLGQLAFEGATRKTRPMLAAGGLVYARVARVERGGEVEIECVDPATGKSGELGVLKGGTVVDVSPEFARRLVLGAEKGGVVVLEELGSKMGFEVAVGRNGRVWIDGGGVKETLKVVRALRETDQGGLEVGAQKKLVERILREG
ncbi:hypothetical protein K461DRAFT_290784 [Myriangium duriaei CBS 260.36]|uniref:K Homology domain-containing protein n=1 Tax=Myriangium duriaei CBS 260.36 TaxID=1168546 RepID=A0A9P4MIB3_9PEZI|nr:hypothetical protein K461DRAFT_290784 [Myriangium duriaei CBS 260.36]